MAVDHGRGFNPMHGFDLLPPPPALNSIHPTGFQTFPSFPGFGVPQQQPMFAAQQTAYAPAQFPPYPIFPGFQGYQGYGQPQPAPPPFIPPGFPPNLNLINHKGGFGLPPGYDYAFPREHCKIHVFKTGNTPPWQMTIHSADTTLHTKLYVPCNTTVKELMQNLGCTNPEAKLNKLYEVVEAGAGKWARGLSVKGDMKDMVKKEIRALGWDKTRSGGPGERPIVWLYCTKD